MPLRNQSLATTSSIRPYLHGAVMVLLLLFSLFIIHAERQGKQWSEASRLLISSVATPVANVVASPVEAIESLMAAWTERWSVYEDNKFLRYENAQLKQWHGAALRLEAENNALKELLKYQPALQARYTTAKVMGPPQGVVGHVVPIDVGLEQQVGRHYPAINEDGLVGRVSQAGKTRSELLLITDVRSRIPVELQPSGIRALLVGAHDDLPYLKLADPKSKPQLGDQVLTSGDGDVMPAGLLIGKLFAEQQGRYQVRPAFDVHRLDYVRVMHHP